MPANPADWDAKHRLAGAGPLAEPASIVSELLPLLPTGPALDLACGQGRHALPLAQRGQAVTAVDFSSVALDSLEARARGMKLQVRHGEKFPGEKSQSGHGLELFLENLEQIRLPENRYELILCVQYLQRSLFPQMARALRAGGVLLMETFTKAQMEFSGGPKNPEYLLETGELRESFPELTLLFYREIRAGQGIASIVAKKPVR
jgi:tellurite methyltransferase